MIEKGEKFLPIGTVVMLKGGSKRVMISGFCAMSEEAGDKMYDYSGCIYPEGFISSDQTCLFDHEQIETVYFKGFVDDEETSFKSRLNELLKSMGQGEIEIKNDEIGMPAIEDDFIKNFPGPIDDVMKELQQNNETSEVQTTSSLEEDDFIKNFPGPIDDVMNELKNKDSEVDTIESIDDLEVISVEDDSANNQSFEF